MNSPEISYRTRLSRNVAAAVLGNIWTMVLLLASVPVLLRGLGAERFGTWAIVQTFSATNGWLSILTVGLGFSLARHIAEVVGAGQSDGDVVASGFAVFAGLGVLAAALLALVGPALVRLLLGSSVDDDLRLTLLLFAAQVLGEFLLSAAAATLEGRQRVDLSRGLEAFRRTMLVLFSGVAALRYGTLTGVAAAGALATLLTIGTAIALVSRRSRLGRPRRASVIPIVRYGSTLGGLTATGVVHRTMDRTIAGTAFGPGSVALVDVANQIQAGCTAVLSALTYPILSSAPWLRARKDEVAVRDLIDRTTRYSVLFTLPLVGLVFVLSGPFVTAWVGEDLSDAIGLTQVAVLYVAVVAPAQALSNHLQGAGKARGVLGVSVVSVLVNLLVSVLAVRRFGLVGVFIGTLAGSAVILPMLARAAEADLGSACGPMIRRAVVRALPAVVAAAIAASVALALPLPDVATVAIGGALAATSAAGVALRTAFEPGETASIIAAMRRRGTGRSQAS